MTTDTDTVTAPDDLTSMGLVAHWVCSLCYPHATEDVFIADVKGVCGTMTIGVLAPPDSRECKACQQAKHPHWATHF